MLVLPLWIHNDVPFFFRLLVILIDIFRSLGMSNLASVIFEETPRSGCAGSGWHPFQGYYTIGDVAAAEVWRHLYWGIVAAGLGRLDVQR